MVSSAISESTGGSILTACAPLRVRAAVIDLWAFFATASSLTHPEPGAALRVPPAMGKPRRKIEGRSCLTVRNWMHIETEIEPTVLAFDVETVRDDFPMLETRVHGKPIVYLDNAASSLKPSAMIDCLERFYSSEFANTKRRTACAKQLQERYGRCARPLRNCLAHPVRKRSFSCAMAFQEWYRHDWAFSYC